MADNKQLPATGTGTANIVVGTDEITGVDYQQIKLVNGTLGSTTAAIVDANGSLQTTLLGAGGEPATVTEGGFLQVELGNVAANLLGSQVEDTAAADSSSAIAILGVRNDADAARTSTDGDYSWLSTDSTGKLKVTAVVTSDPMGGAVKQEDSASSGGEYLMPTAYVRNDADATKTDTDGDFGMASLDRAGRQKVRLSASTGTLSNVAGSATSVTVLAANVQRVGATIWNDSTAICYVKFGATASTTSCTVKLIADAYYEVPFGYTGIIDGIWASATGNARVTELT